MLHRFWLRRGEDSIPKLNAARCLQKFEFNLCLASYVSRKLLQSPDPTMDSHPRIFDQIVSSVVDCMQGVAHAPTNAGCRSMTWFIPEIRSVAG